MPRKTVKGFFRYFSVYRGTASYECISAMCDANIELAVTSNYNKIVNVNDFTYFKRKEPMF